MKRADDEAIAKSAEHERSVRRAKIRQGMGEALSVFNRGMDLPKYLEAALIRYLAAVANDDARRLIIPKLVKQAHDLGLPLSKKSTRKQGAFEIVAARLHLSESTVERAFGEYPPSPDDAALPAKRRPALASKRKGKSSKR